MAQLRNPFIHAIFAQTPPSLRSYPHLYDSVLLLPPASGIFTAKSAWSVLTEKYPFKPLSKIICGGNSVPV